ncbi:MAG: Na/Pi cotransporter family protein [Gammaproteobacteria bacterium]|nr:Na/Pi cotransporter family protein [Gammaproteobacteria bacterium]NNJ92849.1 Na/Pi symporter [Gammaproteobacteria bacterium]
MEYGLFEFLTLLGSLGLFLYGMKVMSDSLLKLAGDKMRSILAASTSNRFLALLTGFFITSAIQSSSATTLMVVSFVNAQLLTLTEAVGVIMGANIGTTITAWLISILGFKVKMSAIALPLVGVGFLLSFSRQEKRKHFGMFLVGFALLFIGLQFLKDSVPDIGAHPETLEFLRSYTQMGYLSILLFLIIGTLLTLIIQSSSATMALTLLMTHQGWIPFDMACAMVLGENIGTTITANLAAIISNFHAKRAALAHLIFNLLGVLWVLILFYPFLQVIDIVVTNIEGQSPMVTTLAVPVAIALFHTCFNILNAFILIWFLPVIVKIVIRLVPEVIEKAVEVDVPKYLDEGSMKYPQTAIKAIYDESIRLLQNTAYMVIVNGLNVHRKDLESDVDLDELIEASSIIKIDIEQIYSSQIKNIYGAILEYATKLQSRMELKSDEVERIRNLLIADRKLVSVVKKIKRLRANIDHYEKSDNAAIRREYNLLKHRILKVVRLIHTLESEDEKIRSHFTQKLLKQRRKAKELDVLRNGRIDKLLLAGDIDEHMASSLMNDSLEAMRMAQMLVDIILLMHLPEDEIMNTVEDEIAPACAVFDR